ncbi:MAG TPA: hypothetical protein VEZ20_15095 [Allosphingosinicella sp.]|nr:hypothetical protein [Allosphingosinicella sp.]
MNRNLKFFAEIASAAAATSFLASAVIQIGLFALWGLDYAAIASVEDVVLGGARLFAAVVISGFILLTPPVTMMLTNVASATDPLFVGQLRKGFLFALLAVAPSATLLFYFPGIVRQSNAKYAVALIVIASSVLQYYVALAASKAKLRMIIPYMRPMTALLPFYACLCAAGVSAWTVSGYKSLEFTNTSVLPTNCRETYAILWVGRGGFVLSCRDGRHVLLRNDDPPPLLRPR